MILVPKWKLILEKGKYQNQNGKARNDVVMEMIKMKNISKQQLKRIKKNDMNVYLDVQSEESTIHLEDRE